ncbi:hypothetical protein ACJMK2_030711 [Sinanodonta woodiana]|uniref:Uncharacterized protein n=1 Tax=Sinanodonta woodiana TaxID=1069815 RepID=A0ABD3WWJ8_SINWO
MQKEITAKRGQIDSLQSKVRWLEEKIDSQSRTRVNLETDKERLKTSLNKALLQNQELSADLEVAKSRCDDLRAQIKKLETALEKVGY